MQQAALEAHAQDATTTATSPAPDSALFGDLLHRDAGANSSDINLWDGDTPPGAAAIQVEVHTAPSGGRNINTGLTPGQNNITGSAAKSEDPDKITVADDEQSSPPPSTQQAGLPQLNPFTPEWFQQLIGSLSLIHI